MMDPSNLTAGDEHYMAYVGPPALYDVMGATQFRLLTTLGLRARHRLLDLGCGSLRAGRFFISYLDPDRYFGIEPNNWLIETAIDSEIGKDMVGIKRPRFDNNADFDTAVFGEKFDFIVAQSVFSHTGQDLLRHALQNVSESLAEGGLLAATFVERQSDHKGDGWVYPACVGYRRSTVSRLARDANLSSVRIPWYHREQTWYLLAREPRRLPTRSMLRYLKGATLGDPELAASWQRDTLGFKATDVLSGVLPQPLKDAIKAVLRVRSRG